jgi:hypothetical protein
LPLVSSFRGKIAASHFWSFATLSGGKRTSKPPRQRDSNMANSEDSDKAFAKLFELFSKAKKSPQKAFRTYQLTF